MVQIQTFSFQGWWEELGARMDDGGIMFLIKKVIILCTFGAPFAHKFLPSSRSNYFSTNGEFSLTSCPCNRGSYEKSPEGRFDWRMSVIIHTNMLSSSTLWSDRFSLAPLLEKDCAVCKDQFQLNTEDPAEQVVVTLPCKHPFHEPCIMPWLKSSGTCPVCRSETYVKGFEASFY